MERPARDGRRGRGAARGHHPVDTGTTAEPEHARQARNDLGNVGYDGPLGTAGRDVKLRLTVLAVDAPIDLEAGADARAVLEEARRHEVDRAEITVSYERPRP